MIQSKKIVIVGGAGFIGTMLSQALLKRGYRITVLDKNPSRISHPDLKSITTDASHSITTEMLLESWGIINLAGAPISKRWTKAYKKTIYKSRINTTKNIVDAVSQLESKPHVLVSASAVGYYGDQGNQVINETTMPGKDFLAKLCVDWEKEALRAQDLGIRVAIVRTANVLGPGGLLQTLRPLFRYGLGGYFGNGNQYMPWVHWKDIVSIYIWLVEHELSGAYNTAAPQAVTQKELFKAFARSIKAPWILPVPYFFARIVVGEFAQALIASQYVDSTKLSNTGFVFQVSDIDQALQ